MDIQLPAGVITTKRVDVWRGQRSQIEEVAVVSEEPLIIAVNGQQIAALMRLPGHERELAAGFLVSEGIITGFEAVLTIAHCGSEPGTFSGDDNDHGGLWRNRVDVRVAPGTLNPEARLDVLRLVRAGCGAVEVSADALPYTALPRGMAFQATVLTEAALKLREGQSVHSSAGGTHAAAIFAADGTRVALYEDIGRHNAVDKASGYCLMQGVPLHDKFLLCSGRLSYEMVNKALHLKIPLVASVSAPTSLALQLAEAGNVTVVGYLRGGRMTVYTHPERVVAPAA